MAEYDLDTINRLRLVADVTDDDATLSAYLDTAKWEILTRLYPYSDGTEELPKKFVSKQIAIAAYLLNKRGAEGETVHLENGIHRHYGFNNIPDDFLSDITPMCGVIR